MAGPQEVQALTGNLEDQVLSDQKCGQLRPSQLILALLHQMEGTNSRNLGLLRSRALYPTSVMLRL